MTPRRCEDRDDRIVREMCREFPSPEIRDLLRDLRDVGTCTIEHRYAGDCPGPGDCVAHRDDACPACRILRRVDALLGDAQDDSEPSTRRP